MLGQERRPEPGRNYYNLIDCSTGSSPDQKESVAASVDILSTGGDFPSESLCLSQQERDLAKEPPLPPISINWHCWPHCNYHCRFCFATFRDVPGILPREEALRVPQLLAEAGCQKLSFVGGEPTLCPYLGDLLYESKQIGLTTMLISNGTGLSNVFLEKNVESLDWIGLSIDSANEATQAALGRGYGHHIRDTVAIWHRLEDLGIPRKLNTVVTALTWQEDMRPLIDGLAPNRWKVFQVLPIEGQNDGRVEGLLITEDQFLRFIEQHQEQFPVYETNEAMQGSYVMLDALGRFFQNTTGRLVYSQSILEIPVIDALNQVGWDSSRFLRRKGLYDWSSKRWIFDQSNGLRVKRA
ncbi:MAG: viperin family antiviral radical SAM protein [Candidatus Heimdallarchaeota archaeon]